MRDFIKKIFFIVKKAYGNKLVSNLLKTGFTLLVFYILFRHIDFKQALAKVGLINLPLLGFNMLLGLIFIQLSTVLRLKVLLDHNGIRVPFRELLRYHFISLFFQNILPSSLGSDAVKIYYLRNKSGLGRVSAIVLFSRFIGIFTMAFIGIVSLNIFINRPGNAGIFMIRPPWPFLMLLAGACVILILFIKPFTRLYKKNRGGIKLLKYPALLESVYGSRALLLSFLYSLLIQFTSIFGTYLYYAGIGIFPDFKKCLILIPAALIIAFIVPSINGMGVREYFLYTFFSREITSVENMFLVSLQITASIFFTALIGWIVYFFKKRRDGGKTPQKK